METQNIVVDRVEARALYRKYREHQHYSTPIDWEIQRTYQLIAQGRIVIKALDSIAAAGLGEDRLPKLAIVRADAKECLLQTWRNGVARFSMNGRHSNNHTKSYIELPAGSLHNDLVAYAHARAIVPLIPIHLRPKRGLANYHLLWEAEWRRVPPVDPMLLRRIGQSDLWVLCAAWDLSEVERAVLASRINA